MRRVSRATAALVVLGTTVAAHADPEIVELHYDAPAGCPARSAFESAVLERTPNVRLAAPAHRVFAVTIEATADGYRGALVVDRVADKELAAPRCDDLATALALVTALAIDPTAAPPRPGNSASHVDPTGAAPGPAGAVGVPIPRDSAARNDPVSPAASHVEPTRPDRRRARAHASHETDAGAMIARGVSPDSLFAVMVEGRAILGGAYPLELAALIGRDTAARGGARAQFTWFAARLGACRLWHLREVAVDACGHFEAGVVRASGEQIINQRDLTRLWLASGLHGAARYPLGSRGFGVLQVGASLPLVRDRYLFAPNVTVHETPAVAGWVVAGIGIRFR
jgi:hypothetical protein